MADNSTDELSVCGAADCPWYNMTSVAQRPSDDMVMCISVLLFDAKYSSGFQFWLLTSNLAVSFSL